MDKLKEVRKSRGISQMELADKVGISQTTLSMYETCRRDGSVRIAKAICKVLNCTLNDIITV